MVELWLTVFRATGLQGIASPWLGAFLCNVAFGAIAFAIAVASVRVHRESRLPPKVRAWIVLGLAGVLAIAMVIAWPLSLMSGAQAGVVRDPIFLVYALVLIALGCLPIALVFWRTGLLKQNAT